MIILFKRTDELSNDELIQIADLYEKIFHEPRSVADHLKQFVNNPFGYSYHSIILDNNTIVGINTYVPVKFLVDNKESLFVNSIDSMVDKSYRDFFAYNDMVRTAYRELKKEGVQFVYGYPNDNAYPVVIKSKLMKNIGKMRIYCLPYRIGGIISGLSIFNPITKICSNGFVKLCGLISRHEKDTFRITKDNLSYNQTRYNRGEYNKVKLKNGVDFFYKIKNHEGVKTAFIIDLSEKSSKSFNLAVKYLLKYHQSDFDLILYTGWLNQSNSSLIKLPRRFEPKNFNLTGKILDSSLEFDGIWDIRNWDTNLSNYDLI